MMIFFPLSLRLWIAIGGGVYRTKKKYNNASREGEREGTIIGSL